MPHQLPPTSTTTTTTTTSPTRTLREKWTGPSEFDEDMPRPKGLRREPVTGIPGPLNGKEAGWVEKVWKINCAGLRKERYLVVLEHFLVFAHSDGIVSQVSCLADLTHVYYTEHAKRLYIESRDVAKGFHWEPKKGSPWAAIDAINNARHAFTTRPLRVTRTSAITHSIKSRCISVTPPLLSPKMEYTIAIVKRPTTTGSLGISLCGNTITGVAPDSPGDLFGVGSHVGERVIAANGYDLSDIGLECVEGRRVVLVLDSTKIAGAEIALELPMVVELERKGLGEGFGLKFKDSLMLYDVSKRCGTASTLKRLKGLVVTHVDGTPVSTTSQIQSLTGHALSTRFAFDSYNVVVVDLPPGPTDFSRAGLTVSSSLEVLSVKKNSPSHPQCLPYSKNCSHRILKANDTVVETMEELKAALEGYLTFRLFFATIPRAR